LAWFITFNFVNISWVFFRAKEWEDAVKVLRGMVNVDNINFSIAFLDKISMWINIPLHHYVSFSNTKFVVDETSIPYIILFTFIVLFSKNSMFYYTNNKLTLKMMIIGVLAFSYSVVNSFFTSTEVFLYFNF